MWAMNRAVRRKSRCSHGLSWSMASRASCRRAAPYTWTSPDRAAISSGEHAILGRAPVDISGTRRPERQRCLSLCAGSRHLETPTPTAAVTADPAISKAKSRGMPEHPRVFSGTPLGAFVSLDPLRLVAREGRETCRFWTGPMPAEKYRARPYVKSKSPRGIG
jgi:hypothetical protein